MTNSSMFKKNLEKYLKMCDDKRFIISVNNGFSETIIHMEALNMAREKEITYYRALVEIERGLARGENEHCRGG